MRRWPHLPPPEEASSAVAAIWTRSRGRALARVAVLEEAVAALVEESLSKEQQEAAEREAHRLAGSVGTFGFSRASAAARQLEQIFAGTEVPSDVEIMRACRRGGRTARRPTTHSSAHACCARSPTPAP